MINDIHSYCKALRLSTSLADNALTIEGKTNYLLVFSGESYRLKHSIMQENV